MEMHNPSPMRSIAHVVNLAPDNEATRKSYLHVAQPVTARSMSAARDRVAEPIDVELLAVRHRTETGPLPAGFRELKPIATYAWEHLPEISDPAIRRNFIRLGDVLGAAHEESDSEWLVYTNSDIGLQPHFYREIADRIRGGWDAFCINRQDLPKAWRGQTLDADHLETIWEAPGFAHRGIDCFVFRRELVPKLDLGDVFIGAPPVGLVLMQQIRKHARNFGWIKTGRHTFHLGSDRAWRQSMSSPYARANLRAAQGRFEPQRLQLPLGVRLWRRLRRSIGLNPTA